MTIRRLMPVAFAAVSAVTLAACTPTTDDADTTVDTDNVVATSTETLSVDSVTTTEDDAETTVASTTGTTADTANANAAVNAEHDDPAFTAIAAVVEAHPDGVIADIETDDDHYEIYVVVGNQVIEYDVTRDGRITEDDRSDDSDLIARASQATVSAEEALQEALRQYPNGRLDEMELDDDNGYLYWDIDLDDAQGNDLAEVEIPA